MLRLRPQWIRSLAALLVATSIAVPSFAGPDVEEGTRDAGGTAKSAKQGKGSGPALQLSGTLEPYAFLPGDIVDMFLIYVPNPATFVAATDSSTTWDTELWLFRVTFDALGNPLAAYAIAGNDDDPTVPGAFSSRVTFPAGRQYPAGVYAVAITPWPVRAFGTSASGVPGELFEATPTDGLFLPTQFSTERPVAFWDGNYQIITGPYHVLLQGATLIPPGTGSAVCGDIFSGDCLEPHTTTKGCSDPTCCQIVCAVDPACCTIAWDEMCALTARQNCLTCQTPVTPCPADLNGDGVVNGADLGLLLTAWGVCP